MATTIPCPPLPGPKTLEIPLPFGAELKSFVDASKGAPTDCALVHSLMLQVTPMLASMACIFKILGALKAIEELLKPPPMMPDKIADTVKALGDLAQCFTAITPPGIAPLIAGILRMVITFINCFIRTLESVMNAHASIDLAAAEGNPVLVASLECARDNAQASMDSMTVGLGAVQPLMDMVGMVAETAGLSLELPSVAEISDGGDPAESIRKLRDMTESLQVTIDALPV